MTPLRSLCLAFGMMGLALAIACMIVALLLLVKGDFWSGVNGMVCSALNTYWGIKMVRQSGFLKVTEEE